MRALSNAVVLGELNTVPSGVTTLVLAYNNSLHLGEAIQSALAQVVDSPHRIWICDDNSTDGTQDLIAKLHRDNPSVITGILQRNNLYQAGVRQRAWYYELVEHGYVANLDADDLWLDPKKLQMQIDAFRDCSHLSLVCSGWSRFRDHNEVSTYIRAYPYRTRYFSAPSLASRNPLCTSGTLFRISDYQRVSVFVGDAPQCQDWELWMALATLGPVKILPKAAVGLRIHESSYKQFRELVGEWCNPRLSRQNFARLSRWHRFLFAVGIHLRLGSRVNQSGCAKGVRRVSGRVSTLSRITLATWIDVLSGALRSREAIRDLFDRVHDVQRSRT